MIHWLSGTSLAAAHAVVQRPDRDVVGQGDGLRVEIRLGEVPSTYFEARR